MEIDINNKYNDDFNDNETFYSLLNIVVVINSGLRSKIEMNISDYNEYSLYSNYSNNYIMEKEFLRKLIMFKSKSLLGSLKTGLLDFEIFSNQKNINKDVELQRNNSKNNNKETYISFSIKVRNTQINLIKTILLMLNSIKIYFA